MRYRLQIIVILFFIGISFARQANTEPLNFSVNVMVNSGYDYFTGETIAINPLTGFNMSFALELGESWIQTTTDPEYQSTKSWLYLNSSLSLSPFTSQLLSVAGDVPLQYSNQSFARQVYTDYFNPDHYDAYDRSLYIAEGFNFYDDLTNRRYQYWRGLTITSLAPLSSRNDVSIFDQNTLSDFINDALSGSSNYILYFSESGIWQDLTTYNWGSGYIYTSNNVSGVSLISEPSTFLQLAIGIIGIALTYCSRIKKLKNRRSEERYLHRKDSEQPT